MYKKVINNDGQYESLNDKRASSLMLQSGLISIIENLRCKVMSYNDLEGLEEMLIFLRHIKALMVRVVRDDCGQDVRRPVPTRQFFPLIRQSRQMDIHSILCEMADTMSKMRKIGYFKNCTKVGALNSFLSNLHPSLQFLQNFLLKTPHFHVVLPPPEPKK